MMGRVSMVLALLFAIMAAGGGDGHAYEEYIVGDDENPWFTVSEAMTLVDTSGGSIEPLRLDPNDNLSLYIEERGGELWAPLNSWTGPEEIALMVDGDLSTAFVRLVEPNQRSVWSRVIRIDLGGRFPVNRIVFYPRPGYEERQIPWFRLYINNGLLFNSAKEPIWTTIRRDTENADVVVTTEFETQPIRYVGFYPEAPKRTWEVGELEIYGEGYVEDASYTSNIIDFEEIASWGKIRWQGEQDPEGKVFIQTRTGLDEDPNIYWRKTGVGDEITNRRDDGNLLTAGDYKSLPNTEKAGTTYDTENWSFWSAPYDFHGGLAGEAGMAGGVLMTSPGPRRYFQVKVDFRSTSTDGGRIDWLGFELSRPPAADAAVAEVWPLEVEPAMSSEFVYSMSPTIRGSNTGFNSLEIFTAVQPDGVDFVKIDDREVDLGEHAPEILSDRLVVHFPLMGEGDSGSLVEVGFRSVVLRYGTEFSGWVYDNGSDEVYQLVSSGDASDRYDGDELSVRTSLDEGLIRSVALSGDAFSPNGDGVNDALEIRFDVLKLTGDVPIDVSVYDLGGRRVREVYRELGRNGRYEAEWDGLDDGGKMVLPGVYVYRISVESDMEDRVYAAPIAVVY